MTSTLIVAQMQAPSTMFGADVMRPIRLYRRVLSHEQLIAELERLKNEGQTTNADLARLWKLPSSRVSELFAGKRRITVDEMKAVVEHFGLDAAAPAPNARMLAPLLDALLPLVPPGDQSGRSVEVVSEALSYGLQLLEATDATPASEDALKVAARAVAARFRDLSLQ